MFLLSVQWRLIFDFFWNEMTTKRLWLTFSIWFLVTGNEMSIIPAIHWGFYFGFFWFPSKTFKCIHLDILKRWIKSAPLKEGSSFLLNVHWVKTFLLVLLLVLLKLGSKVVENKFSWKSYNSRYFPQYFKEQF